MIYVLDGIGYSIVEGERIDRQKGSLLMLPMKPGGVEHQHFDLDPDKPAHWAAFVPIALTEHVASQLTQTENSPEYPRVDDTMLTPQENERLTRVGPGTPCGALLRRYWQALCPTKQLSGALRKNVCVCWERICWSSAGTTAHRRGYGA